MIITPIEFYQQLGADNDIDTVTASFRYIDDRGHVIKEVKEDYSEIVKEIATLEDEIFNSEDSKKS